MADEDRRALRASAFVGLSKAARDLHLGRGTLRQAVARGELTTYVFGQRARVKLSDLHAWIAAHRTPRR